MPFNPGLGNLEAYTDTLEALIASTNTLLTTIRDNADDLEGYTDQIEGLLTTANTLLTTIRDNADQLEGYVDGVEALITSTNSLLTTIRDNADQLEGYTDGIEGLLTTIQGNVDQLEGYVDDLESLTTTFSAKFDTQSSVQTSAEKTFSAATNLINIGTSETAFYLLKNPSGSGKNLRILRIAPGTGGGTFRLYHTPTITSNGTSLTIVNHRIKTSPTASIAEAYSQPTISANGTLIEVASISAQQNTREIDFLWQPIIEPNFNLLVTFQNGSNNTPTNCSMTWMEI